MKTFETGFYRVLLAGTLVAIFSGLAGCQTLQQIAQLRHVDFAIDRASQSRLAGVDLERIQRFEDIRPIDVARLGTSIAEGRLPLSFRLHIAANNPEENNVSARLLRMDWTLFLEDRETVSGRYEDEVLLPPGQVTDVPLDISLDLVQFFGDNLRDLVNLALAATGQNGPPTRIRLEATPSIDTPVGPIRYPRPVTIVSREVGGSGAR